MAMQCLCIIKCEKFHPAEITYMLNLKDLPSDNITVQWF